MKYLIILLSFTTSIALAQKSEENNKNDSKGYYSFVDRQISYFNTNQEQSNLVVPTMDLQKMAFNEYSEIKIALSALDGGKTSQYFNDQVEISDGFYQFNRFNIGNINLKSISEIEYDFEGKIIKTSVGLQFD